MNGPNNAIGWCDYTWNPVTGCKLGCKFGASGARCYAAGIARRFAGGKAFPNGFEPTFHPNRLDEPLRVKTPSRVFVSSMGELFGPWVPEEWRQAVLDAIRRAPQHQFIMLTKVPRIARRYAMPDNVCLGTTITGDLPHEARRLAYVREFQAPVRFLSIEPLVAPVDVSAADPDWLIIAAATGPGGFQPQEPWVQALEDYADERGIPVYEKDNLKVRPVKRQEWPAASRAVSPLVRPTAGCAAGRVVAVDAGAVSSAESLLSARCIAQLRSPGVVNVAPSTLSSIPASSAGRAVYAKRESRQFRGQVSEPDSDVAVRIVVHDLPHVLGTVADLGDARGQAGSGCSLEADAGGPGRQHFVDGPAGR